MGTWSEPTTLNQDVPAPLADRLRVIPQQLDTASRRASTNYIHRPSPTARGPSSLALIAAENRASQNTTGLHGQPEAALKNGTRIVAATPIFHSTFDFIRHVPEALKKDERKLMTALVETRRKPAMVMNRPQRRQCGGPCGLCRHLCDSGIADLGLGAKINLPSPSRTRPAPVSEMQTTSWKSRD
jgi:hypothetical protein